MPGKAMEAAHKRAYPGPLTQMLIQADSLGA